MLQRAFTLIELSIVLVIIGLIVGGVLVGRDLIEAAKIRKTISQITEFNTAAYSFKIKYNGIPGDSTRFGGDGDGIIEGTNAFTNWNGHQTAYSGENANAFAQMFPGLYVGGTYTIGGANAADPLVPNVNAPGSAMNPDSSVFFIAGNRNTNATANYYAIVIATTRVLSNFTRLYPSSEGNVTLTPSQLYAIDTKLDNGYANSGIVLSASFVDGGAGTGVPSTSGNPGCSAGSSYTIATTDIICMPFIKVGF